MIEKSILADSIMDLHIKPDLKNNLPIRYYVVYQYITGKGEAVNFDVQPEFISRFITSTEGFKMNETLTSNNVSYHYLITAVGKNNVESAPVEVNIHKLKGGKWGFY